MDENQIRHHEAVIRKWRNVEVGNDAMLATTETLLAEVKRLSDEKTAARLATKYGRLIAEVRRDAETRKGHLARAEEAEAMLSEYKRFYETLEKSKPDDAMQRRVMARLAELKAENEALRRSLDEALKQMSG